VIFCPMRNFYLDKGGENEIRLTFSNLSLEKIEQGVKQLAAFLKSKVKGAEEAIKIDELEMALAED
jgi:(S)-3,5-dihydroxyphenylglycine transaminase